MKPLPPDELENIGIMWFDAWYDPTPEARERFHAESLSMVGKLLKELSRLHSILGNANINAKMSMDVDK